MWTQLLCRFFFFFLVVLSLRYCVWAFSSCGERTLLSSCSVWAVHCGGFSCCKAWALGTWVLQLLGNRTWAQKL